MIKAPRFLIEYANYKIRQLKNNELMYYDVREKEIEKIERAVNYFQRGFIVIDEAIRIINEC